MADYFQKIETDPKTHTQPHTHTHTLTKSTKEKGRQRHSNETSLPAQLQCVEVSDWFPCGPLTCRFSNSHKQQTQ